MKISHRLYIRLKKKVIKAMVKGKSDYEILKYYEEIKQRKLNDNYDETVSKEDCELAEPIIFNELEKRGLDRL